MTLVPWDLPEAFVTGVATATTFDGNLTGTASEASEASAQNQVVH